MTGHNDNMTINEWMEKTGRSASWMHYEARISLNTVKAAIARRPISYPTAKALVDASKGEINIFSLLEPEDNV